MISSAIAVGYDPKFFLCGESALVQQLEFGQYMRRFCMFTTLLLFVSSGCFAWGPEGHRVVADVAREHLNTTARSALVQLLGDDDLASISTWADEIRRERRETFGWHFVDIPVTEATYDQERDCQTLETGDCAIAELARDLEVPRLDVAPARGMGGGDVKLMAGFGAVLGAKQLLEAALWTAGCGGVMALLVISAGYLRQLLKKGTGEVVAEKDTRRAGSIPYAPAIAAGVWLSLVPKT